MQIHVQFSPLLVRSCSSCISRSFSCSSFRILSDSSASCLILSICALRIHKLQLKHAKMYKAAKNDRLKHLFKSHFILCSVKLHCVLPFNAPNFLIEFQQCVVLYFNIFPLNMNLLLRFPLSAFRNCCLLYDLVCHQCWSSYNSPHNHFTLTSPVAWPISLHVPVPSSAAPQWCQACGVACTAHGYPCTMPRCACWCEGGVHRTQSQGPSCRWAWWQTSCHWRKCSWSRSRENQSWVLICNKKNNTI